MNSVVQQNKFCKVLKEKRPTQDTRKVIFNFSKYIISDCEKSLLIKGLNFSIACKNLDYANYLLQFELFFSLMKTWILLKQKLRKKHYLLVELTVVTCLKTCLRKNSLLYKTYLKIKTKSFTNLTKVTLLLLYRGKII